MHGPKSAIVPRARPPAPSPRGSSPLRLLALVQQPIGLVANQRFRHEQWAPHLEREHGITLQFSPFQSPELAAALQLRRSHGRKLFLALRDLARRWTRRHEALAYDGVVVLREATMLGGALIEKYIARRGVPLIYDFDDSVWLTRSDSGLTLTRLAQTPWKAAEICRVASAVVVGNEYLAAYARRHSNNVHIVRTSIDLDRFRFLPPKVDEAPFTIVWTGSRTTLPYLDGVRPALELLASRMPVKLRVICDERPRAYERVALEFIPWSPQVEVTALADSHVGIMPLTDTPWTRGKCACKALQYMAVGRPTVLSPVGMNRQLVQHGENGLYADSMESWVTQLERLAHSSALRRKLAEAGRHTVESGYTARQSAAEFARVVRETLGTPMALERSRAVSAR